MKWRVLLPITLLIGGCDDDDDTYILYRGSTVAGVKRIHVASFDAADGDGYNFEIVSSRVIFFWLNMA